MPRIFAVNHHPEIVDRFRQIMILEQKRDRGEVSHEWYQERLEVLTRTYPDENSDQRLHVTSDYTLLGPLRFHLYRAVRLRAEALGLRWTCTRTRCSPTWSGRRWRPVRPAKASEEARRGRPRRRTPRNDPEAAFRQGPHPRAGDRRVREAEATPHGGVGRPHHARGGAPHLGRGALPHPRPERAARSCRARASTRSGSSSCSSACATPGRAMVYVTSQPVHPIILEYYLQFLAGIPASHARSRLTLLCADDASPRSLTEKILERPRLIERIRAGIVDPSRAYLTVFNSTPLERKLAVLLGVPLNGVDPNLTHLGTKSGSRKVFREAGVDLPAGVRGSARPRADRGGPRGAAGETARHPQGRGQAQRQLLGRRQRALPLPRGRGRAGPPRSPPAGGVLGGPPRPPRPTSRSSRAWAGSSRSSSKRTRSSRPRASSASAPRARWCPSPPTTRSWADRRGQVFLGLQLSRP